METKRFLEIIGKLYVENDELRNLAQHLNNELELCQKEKEQLQEQLLTIPKENGIS